MLKTNIIVKLSLLVPLMALVMIYICERSYRSGPNPQRLLGHPLTEEEAAVSLWITIGIFYWPRAENFAASTVANSIKFKSKYKANVKAKDYSNFDNKLEHFNFENLEISVNSNSKWEHVCKEKLNTIKFCTGFKLVHKDLYYLSIMTNLNKNTKTKHYSPVLCGGNIFGPS